MPKSKKQLELEQHLVELKADLQRTRADFENYRKRIEIEKEHAKAAGKSQTILKLIPVIDNIERAIAHLPEELKENAWAQSVTALIKQLDKSFELLDLHRIESSPGAAFDPTLHEAISFDEEAEGEQEVIADELQSGYKLGNQVIRPAMVRVTRR